MYDIVSFGAEGGQQLVDHLRLVRAGSYAPRRENDILTARMDKPGGADVLIVDAADRRGQVQLLNRGFKFQQADYASPDFLFPETKVTLLWYNTSSLPNPEDVESVVSRAIEASREMVWIMFPNFASDKDDITGDWAARQLGYRFAWSTWPEFTSKCTLNEYVAAVRAKAVIYKAWNRIITWQVVPQSTIRYLSADQLVKLDAPADERYYDNHRDGDKPKKIFGIPLVSHYELAVFHED